jgi:5'-nucleotidase (lipoprotein e(P4) family)
MLRNLLTAIAISVSLTSIAQHDHIHINLKENPVLFHQTAAEYRALCYQAFNLATLRVKELPKKEFKKNKLAIITDIDETILDNSYSEAQLIKESRSYSSESWLEWTNKSAATPVPGAKDFLQYAASRGIEIFYISNRKTIEVNSTIINLKKYDLPFADSAHMLFKVTEDTKKARRQQVMSEYKVVLLMGDNLNDFSEVFESGNIEARFTLTDAAKDDWGRKFIVIPNCIYGEWEGAIYNYQRNLPAGQKQNIRFNTMKGH